jgi:hypothetical protein
VDRLGRHQAGQRHGGGTLSRIIASEDELQPRRQSRTEVLALAVTFALKFAIG